MFVHLGFLGVQWNLRANFNYWSCKEMKCLSGHFWFHMKGSKREWGKIIFLPHPKKFHVHFSNVSSGFFLVFRGTSGWLKHNLFGIVYKAVLIFHTLLLFKILIFIYLNHPKTNLNLFFIIQFWCHTFVWINLVESVRNDERSWLCMIKKSIMYEMFKFSYRNTSTNNLILNHISNDEIMFDKLITHNDKNISCIECSNLVFKMYQ